MQKLTMLSFANIRKSKGHTVSLFLMFLIAALLLNAGSLVFANFGGFFDKITQELQTSDAYYIIPNRMYSEKIDSYLKANPNVQNVQKAEALWANGAMPYHEEKREARFLLYDADSKREQSKWKWIGEQLPPDSMSIYLPYVMHVDGGYKLNDPFELTIKDKSFTFTIKGFTEDAFFSSLDTGNLGAYLPHETYESVEKQLGASYEATVLFANLEKSDNDVEAGIRSLLPKDESAASSQRDGTGTMFSIELKLVQLSRTLMSSMVSVMMMAFAAIIALVCLIVVRFRIGNSIEEDMTKIGSLKAVGYTSRQIMGSIVLQYTLIALVGSVVGISISYAATPMISNVFAHQSGLVWVQGFDGGVSSIVLCALLMVVMLVSFLTSRQLRRLSPIVALRGGIVTHSFKRNHMPLHRTRGRLPFVLGLKSMLQNSKQSIMIGVIVAAVSFASTFGLVMFYNTTVDTKAFAETPGIEISNAVAVLKPDGDHSGFVESVRSMSEVRKAQFIDQTTIKIEDTDVATFVMDDYSAKETNTVYKGRYPLHGNEVVLAGVLAEKLDKTVGDQVTIQVGDKQGEYRVTGLSQGSNMGGMNASLRTDGLIPLHADYKQQSLQIYLKSGSPADEFVNKLEQEYSSSLIQAVDMDKTMEQGMGMYVSIVSKVGTAMLVITIVVVMLVLYFVIHSSIIRKKRELGIQKAIGFTTLQLMNQLSLGFLPPILIGVLVGSAIGITQTNAVMSVAQRAMGIMKANYVILPSWVALFGAGLILLSYFTSMLITYRIRKISAYALVSE